MSFTPVVNLIMKIIIYKRFLFSIQGLTMKNGLLLLCLLMGWIMHVQAKTNTDISDKLIGIWAMQPLSNGIANVIEFSKDGKITNNMFRCDWLKKSYDNDGVEISRYEVEENGVYILNLNNQSEIETALVVDYINENSMSVRQLIDPENAIRISYIKVETIKPLCRLKILSSI